MKKIITKSEKETFELAVELAGGFCGGEVIALQGDLGAGKTVFTKGVAKGLKVKNNITSPTFVIMKVYNAQEKNIKRLCHIDAYRLLSEEELEALGVEEYFNDEQTITIIEWPENVKKILPKKTRSIKIKHLNENEREIRVY